MVLAQFIGKIL